MGIDKEEIQVPTNDKALSTALEMIKQIITLDAGILALSATFIPSLSKYSIISFICLVANWICFITSIICGINSISAMVRSQIDNDNKWNEGCGKNYALVSKITFVFGFCILVAFAISVLLVPVNHVGNSVHLYQYCN
jgi:hypothetical protein